MRRQLLIHPHLTIVTLATFGLAAATALFLDQFSRHFHPDRENWVQAGASWGAAFCGQFCVWLAVVCPTAAHALSRRWSWSVGLLTAVSAYWGVAMAMLVGNAYEDALNATGHVKTPAEFLEAALTLAAIFLFYILFVVLTLVWIATRGRRFQFRESGGAKGE